MDITLVVTIKIIIKVAMVKVNTPVEVMEVDMISIQIQTGMTTTDTVVTIAETIMGILHTMEDNKAIIENLINLETEKKVAQGMETTNMEINLATIQIADHIIITTNTIQVKVDIMVVKEMIIIVTTTNRMIQQVLKGIIILIHLTLSSINKTLLQLGYKMDHSNNLILIINIHTHQQDKVQDKQQLVIILATSSINSILKPTSNNIPSSIINKEFKVNQMAIPNNRIMHNHLNLAKLE